MTSNTSYSKMFRPELRSTFDHSATLRTRENILGRTYAFFEEKGPSMHIMDPNSLWAKFLSIFFDVEIFMKGNKEWCVLKSDLNNFLTKYDVNLANISNDRPNEKIRSAWQNCKAPDFQDL